jgi:tRNA-specific 2-thiouridylase
LTPSCVVLYSGGLDSILACKLLQENGVKTIALRFVTPFFGYELIGREEKAHSEAMGTYGIDLRIADISRRFMQMVRNPRHGYGKNLNPCIDCKILMVREALKRLGVFGADFVATGEVLGQRSMSQKRHTLRAIEEESGAKGLLFRPLSALNFPPTPMEEQGLLDRSRFLGLTGRARKEQIALAARYAIADYPAPSGGCLLADPTLSRRFRRMFAMWPKLGIRDLLLAQVGRHFLLPDGSWLVIGRNDNENIRLASLLKEDDRELRMADIPGPTGLWRWAGAGGHGYMAARILRRYAKGRIPLRVTFLGSGLERQEIDGIVPATDETIQRLRL